MKQKDKVLLCVGTNCKTPQGADGEYCSECYKKLSMKKVVKTELRVFFVQGYAGGVKAGVFINDIEYVIDLDWLKDKLEKEILEKGYTTAKSNRQKYPRIIIND